MPTRDAMEAKSTGFFPLICILSINRKVDAYVMMSWKIPKTLQLFEKIK